MDFSIAISPTLTLTPMGGFSAQIALGCTTNAGGSTCTPQTTPLTLTTTSQYRVICYSGLGIAGHAWYLLLGLLSAGSILFRRRTGRALPRLLLSLGLLVGLSVVNVGCSGKIPDKNASPTYPGTYIYMVSATDGTITHTASDQLIVTVK